jgi:hypothetical protein
MILYVNGDSHTAAAEAVNSHAFAEDDSELGYLRRLPHPDNLAVSWGKTLADTLKAGFKCDAESAASNDRIMRTTREWLSQQPRSPKELLMIIQWSTWERQEWLHQGTWYQVNASGTDSVPEELQERYRQYIADVDWRACTRRWHEEIWRLHQDLDDAGVRHVFFNGNNHFGSVPGSDRLDWGTSYIAPYDAKSTFNQWLLDHGHDTVAPNSYHFGRAAHTAWSRFVLQYCIKNQLV